MFIPAAWTNCGIEGKCATESNRICIGLLSDFLRTRKVVDGLLNRQVCLDHEPDKSIRRADAYAAETEASGIDEGTASGANRVRPGRARKDGSTSVEVDGKSNGTQVHKERK